MNPVVLLVLLALTSCAGAVASAPEPRGAFMPINPTKWQDTTNDLTTSPAGYR